MTQKNSYGKVPCLELDNGEVLYESLVVADYLDEKYPEPRLYPLDPLAKAKDKLLIEKFNTSIIQTMYKVSFSEFIFYQFVIIFYNYTMITVEELSMLKY